MNTVEPNAVQTRVASQSEGQPDTTRAPNSGDAANPYTGRRLQRRAASRAYGRSNRNIGVTQLRRRS